MSNPLYFTDPKPGRQPPTYSTNYRHSATAVYDASWESTGPTPSQMPTFGNSPNKNQ